MVSNKEIAIRRLLKDEGIKYGVSKFPALYEIEQGGTYKKIIT